MSDMSTIRKRLGGYKLIKTAPYINTSWVHRGCVMTELVYRSRNGRIVIKDIYGAHTMHDLLSTQSDTNKGKRNV